MKHIDLIIFDLDGTLLDSKNDIANAVNYTLRNLGLKEKDTEEIAANIGLGVESLISRSLGERNTKFFKRALPIFNEYYNKHFIDTTYLYPGVKEVLEYFEDKKKVVITNRIHESAVFTLKEFGVYDFFADIMGGDDTECAKPNSCPLDRMISKLDVNRKHAIIVGDMDIDVKAGKEAGIITCAVTYGIGKKEDIVKANPDYIINDIRSLKEIIK